ncbi:hypothetical protein BT96DRAFT_925870 [Gymnopus androsaceus JB14]|uniref:Amidohydrolase-related domain-containing protein n=1 Tax=Gymnopus androsaceus JB14 TaxID=1447944 RepID=A0A6A4GYU0_9AGAR|nr:hypothetical protein BT96DRAFT_925870 [Gymnopus androsaceus JB14]
MSPLPPIITLEEHYLSPLFSPPKIQCGTRPCLDSNNERVAFRRCLINNHLNGRFYDDAFFWPLFERAEALDVPIYIHPTFPDENTLPQYQGNYSERAAFMLGISAWGWHADTGLHILRLFASGLFDKYPNVENCYRTHGRDDSRGWGQRERGLRQVWQENIWVTTSGMFTLAPLACLLKVTPVEHVLFSVDYPFSQK